MKLDSSHSNSNGCQSHLCPLTLFHQHPCHQWVLLVVQAAGVCGMDAAWTLSQFPDSGTPCHLSSTHLQNGFKQLPVCCMSQMLHHYLKWKLLNVPRLFSSNEQDMNFACSSSSTYNWYGRGHVLCTLTQDHLINNCR